jgi:hypothetical protein
MFADVLPSKAQCISTQVRRTRWCYSSSQSGDGSKDIIKHAEIRTEVVEDPYEAMYPAFETEIVMVQEDLDHAFLLFSLYFNQTLIAECSEPEDIAALQYVMELGGGS